MAVALFAACVLFVTPSRLAHLVYRRNDAALRRSVRVEEPLRRQPLQKRACGLRVECLAPDGKIVVVGTTFYNSTTGYDFVVVRYNANGSLDAGFGVG